MRARICAQKVSYIISVSIGTGCYRHLRVSGNETLHDLADDILWAFDFEHDHLYSFFMDDKWWSDDNAYHSPHGEEPPYADEIKLSHLRLEKGQKFKFIFDYGDEWRFQCKVLQVLDEETSDTEIVRCKGNAPEQYPNYDEVFADSFDVDFEDPFDADVEVPFNAEDDDEGSLVSQISMSVNPEMQAALKAALDIEIPDEVLEAAFQFRSDKLWKQIDDNDFFAVRLSDGEIGYCSVMGSGGACIALGLYIGDVGMWSIDQIFRGASDDTFAVMLAQNCVQLGLDNQSELPDEIIEIVTAYAKAHGISFRGKNSYPNFLKYQSYLMPAPVKSKADYGYLLEALRAAHDVSGRLRSVSKEELGMDKQFATIPLLTPKDGGFELSQIPFPEIVPYPYPKPLIDEERLEAVRALPKKGTLESHVYILSDPLPAEAKQSIIFPPLLVTAGTPAKLKGTIRSNNCYPDSCSALLELLIETMLDANCCPKKIVTAGERSAAFFSDFCKQCGIAFAVAESTPKADKELEDYLQETPSENADLFSISGLLAMLDQMSAEDLRDMPDELRDPLRELMDSGMMSDSLKRKLKNIL
ncbi:MAG: plasmid pRiA4b ORF-3 family protein [Oscillospiraceae bacterium]|nr:plasmid pRiA4b ORF-3 family protein [Oscillospiraceae bacterium]